MSRASKMNFVGSAAGHGAARALLRQLGDVSLDHRSVDRSLVLMCPDGCGQYISVNLDPRAGKAWRTYGSENSLTVFPSVWRDEGCGAHFIIWRGRILWCDAGDKPNWHDEALASEVEQVLVAVAPQALNYVAIAERLGAVPWEVLWTCEALVKRRVAEKRGPSRYGWKKP